VNSAAAQTSPSDPRVQYIEVLGHPKTASTSFLGQIDALRSLYSGWRLPEATLDKGLAGALRGCVEDGRPVAVPENELNGLGYAALEQGKVKEAIMLFQGNVDAN
jgi:hypothetical protein